MKYYKNSNDKIYADPIKLDGLVEITKAEVDAILAPTPEELKEQARLDAKTARDTALYSMTHTLADGAVVQTRPSDLTNFQIAIDIGLPKDWVLADNTVRTLTVAEMGECLNSGIAQADAIWSNYTEFLKAN